MSTFDFVFRQILKIGHTPPTIFHMHCCRIRTSLILKVLGSSVKVEQVTTLEGTKPFFMFRLDVKDDVNVNSKASLKRCI